MERGAGADEEEAEVSIATLDRRIKGLTTLSRMCENDSFVRDQRRPSDADLDGCEEDGSEFEELVQATKEFRAKRRCDRRFSCDCLDEAARGRCEDLLASKKCDELKSG